MYVGVTGTFAAGKGEIVRMLKTKGFRHYGFGELIRHQLIEQGKEPSVENSMLLADKMRTEHGEGYFAELLLHKLEQEAPKDAVLESIRSPGELDVLRRLPGFILLSVDAPREIRFQRLMARGRKDNITNFEEFCKWEDIQLEGAGAKTFNMQLVMDQADVQIVNIGSLEELQAQVEEALNL